MSKRQRRRVSERRTVHMQQVKRRRVLDARLPIALAAVAAPAVAASPAQAAPGTHRGHESLLKPAGQRDAGVSFAGLHTFRERPSRHLVVSGQPRRSRTLPGSFAGLASTGAVEEAAPAPTPAAAPAPTPADAGAAIAPAPAAPPSPADAGATIAPVPVAVPDPAQTGQNATQPFNPQAINPDAPPQAPNPAPPTPPNFGISASASGCLVVCLGATYVATPQGNYLVPEIGGGVGGSVGFDAGPKVAAPEGPELQGSASYKFPAGPLEIGGSGKVTVPLTDFSPGNIGVEGNVGVTNAPAPLNDLSLGGSYSYNKGPAGGVGYDASNAFQLSEQTKGVVTYPIRLPDVSQTSPPDTNGVSDVITQTGTEGPPAMYAVRTLPPGYTDGKGDTVTLNPDGSFTVHTSTADVTTFGPNYLGQQGLDQSQGGTLTHQLIDTLGQRTDQYTWQGADGSTVTQTPSGTLTQTNQDGSTIQQSASGVVTQTNPDGSTVSYDPSTGVITTSDGHWLGTTTMFNPDGSVTQTSPTGTTTWDASGNGLSTYNTGDGFAFPMSTSEPAPSAPAIPPSISLPHGPNPPAPTPNGQQSSNSTPSDQSANSNNNAAPSDTSTATNAAPAPTDTSPAAAPTDSTPAPTDTTPAPTDTTPAPTDTTPAPTDSTPAPAPVDTAPAPVDTAPPVDTTPPPVDITPPVDTAPPPIDTTPPPIDTAPPPIDTTPPTIDTTPAPIDTAPPIDTTPSTDPGSLDSGSLDSASLSGGGLDSGGGLSGGDAGGGGNGGGD